MTVTIQQGTQAVPYVVPLTGTGRARTMAGCGVTAICPGPITVSANSTVTLTPTIMSSGATSCAWSVGLPASHLERHLLGALELHQHHLLRGRGGHARGQLQRV